MYRYDGVLRCIEARAPEIPYLSNVTGTWITEEDVADPSYWARHMRGTVRFAEGLTELLAVPGRIYLEGGPGAGRAAPPPRPPRPGRPRPPPPPRACLQAARSAVPPRA